MSRGTHWVCGTAANEGERDSNFQLAEKKFHQHLVIVAKCSSRRKQVIKQGGIVSCCAKVNVSWLSRETTQSKHFSNKKRID